jgi:hypothetical protein
VKPISLSPAAIITAIPTRFTNRLSWGVPGSNQGLQANKPANAPAGESNYGTNEIPCTLNALNLTSIGYQSGGYPGDKLDFLQSIANSAAYGAQYEELFAADLATFIADHTAVTFGTLSNYGTTDAQNRNIAFNYHQRGAYHHGGECRKQQQWFALPIALHCPRRWRHRGTSLVLPISGWFLI